MLRRFNAVFALALSIPVMTLGCAVEVGDEQDDADYEDPMDETGLETDFDDDATDGGDADQINSVVPGPTWKMAALIFRNIDADLVDPSGNSRHVRMAMTNARRDLLVQTADTMEARWETWNLGHAPMTMTKIEVTTPIRHISRMGSDGAYWVSPQDVAAALDTYAPKGRYDSVFVMWDPGPNGELGYLPGVYNGWGLTSPPSDDTNGMTYATIQPTTGYGGMIHEWMHGAGGFYRSHGLDVPDPHENDTFGFRGTYNGSWNYWYQAALGGKLVKAGTVVGYTSAVFRSGTPRNWIGGSYPAALMPTLSRPEIQATSAGGEWIYTQWAPVRRPSHYTMFLMIVNRDGSVTQWVHRYAKPAIDRGTYDYQYFPKSEVCDAARRANVNLGAVRLRFQVWPDRVSASQATSSDFGSINCL
jgi:hypothetical protein